MAKICRKRANIRGFRRIILLYCTGALIFSLFGCGSRQGSYTAVLEGALDTELTVETPDLTYGVTVCLGAVPEGGAGERDYRLTFFSPDSLAGLSVIRDGDGVRMSRDALTVTLTDEEAEGLLLPVTLLAPASVIRTETGTEDGITCLLLTLSDGRRISVEPASGRLIAVRRGEICGRISWIEPAREGGT